MRKADYAHIASTYDVARPVSEHNLDQWLRLISRRIGPRHRVDFLDLGCGTGRFAIPIASRLGYSVTGADASEQMLARARAKEGGAGVRWHIQDAGQLPYADDCFDAVFMSHLLHHVEAPLQVLRECCRVLRPGGGVLNRYGAIEHIRDDPEHRFFPGVLRIDEARTPKVGQVEQWLASAGLHDISSETVQQRTWASPGERVRAAELKATSALTLISQADFERGLAALREYASKNPEDPWLVADSMTLTAGRTR